MTYHGFKFSVMQLDGLKIEGVGVMYSEVSKKLSTYTLRKRNMIH